MSPPLERRSPRASGTLIRLAGLGTSALHASRAELNFVVTGATGGRSWGSDEVNLSD